MTKNKVVSYIWDENLFYQCDRLPPIPVRSKLVHQLIGAYDLFNKLKVVRSSPASYEDLKEFHSEIYLDHLKKLTSIDEDYTTNDEDEEFGLGYDCPPVSNMFDLVAAIAGGSIAAARCLILGVADVAINWCGGWHHAQRFRAEGFCYVNDIVIAIEKLRKKFPKVLYIDLDVHHGDGVQDAYDISKSVFTLSFHKYEPGFYPGTGGIADIGTLGGTGYSCNVPLHAAYRDDTLEYTFDNKSVFTLSFHKYEPGFYPGTGGIADIGTLGGTGYSCNVPLHAAYRDDTLEYMFDKVFKSIYKQFSPDAIVVQCGADALAGDALGGGNLTTRGYCTCVRTVLDMGTPTMLLGGGGYTFPNAARLWASITALAVGVTLDENIPEHEHWEQYRPAYTIHVHPTLAKDNNSRSYLDECIATIQGNLDKYLQKKSDSNNSIQASESSLLRQYKGKSNIHHNSSKQSQNSDPIETEDIYTFTD